jgi:alkylation response protein AidB-like acyl-CoA dehydrogenase
VSSERDQLFDALTRRLGACAPSAAWEELVAAGVAGFRVAEKHGGLAMAASDAEPIMAALGETGRATPFLENSVVAVGLLGQFSPSTDALLSRIAADGAVCAVAGLDPRLRTGIEARQTGGRWSLSGTAKLVMHGSAAISCLAIVPLASRIGLFLLETEGRNSTDYSTIDGRSASDIVLDGAGATLLSDDAGDGVDAALDEAQACIAVEAAAIMRRLVRDTVEYARQRHQFGQPLAAFQIIQHRLVDMHMQARRASSIARRAMKALGGPVDDRSRLVSAAKATAAQAGRYVGQQAVQLHGAMGMTDELPLSGLFKRLTVIENELGGADVHMARHAALSAG